MLLGILPTTVFAATMIGRSDISVNAPEAGVAPIVFASALNQSLEVTKVEWVGELDGNGCFKNNTAYTINITIRIKAGQDKYLVNQEGGFRVNRKNAVMTSLSGDGQEAVISYTFDNGASSASNNASDNTAAGNAPSEPSNMEDRIDFEITEPVVGALPATAATTTHPDVEVTNVSWSGEFDSDGTFQTAKNYKVTISFKLKDNANKIITTSALYNKATVNGISKVYNKNRSDSKAGFVIHTFEIKPPIPVVDIEHTYSKKQSDEHYYTVYPAGDVEIIVNEGETLTDKVGRFTVAQTNSVKRIVLNYTYNTHKDWYGSDEVTVGKAWDAAIFQSFPNLEELWIGPNVDIVDFLQDYLASYNGGNDLAMPFNSNNSETQNLTMFVSDTVLPNGFTGDWNRVKNPIGADGYMTRDPGPFRRFQSRLYSGADVTEAYKKGASNAREWCTDHDFSELSYTADRVCIMKSCKDIVTYYYSCSKCGRCEYNPNHTGPVNLPPMYSFEMDRMPGDHNCTERNLSDKYFAGVNSRGERVYWKSCAMCAKHPGEALYEGHVPTPTEWVCENATITKDYVESFAVRNERYVTAKMSQWAQNDVQWASQNGILDLNLLGNDYTKPITRLQFASIAVKLAEALTEREILPADSGIFTDTDNEYVLKAYAAGITSGTSATTFDPNGTLTRQQMATFIHRTLMYVRDNTNIRYTIYTPELEKYSDNGAIQDWARTPMGFMNALGLVKGVSDTAIDPDGKCTIEQAAVVANRSVNADQIGWYQVISKGTYYYSPTDLAPTQATFVEGHRIWVSVPQAGGQKASEHPYYYEMEARFGWIETVHPFTGSMVWVDRSKFKPIKDLKDDDEAKFKSFYGK